MAWPDSNTIRVAGYVVVTLLMLIARRRERRRVGDADGVWPAFWILTGAFLLAMAVGRAVDAGDLVSSLGRSAAEERGWYTSRRPVQAAVVGSVGAVWFVVVAVALWRTPERRRRYLPVGLMVVTLAAFAAVRVVSLHQVDSLLYRTEVAGVRFATLTELVLLGLAALATLWCPAARPSPITDAGG
jgi:hypothetical protein